MMKTSREYHIALREWRDSLPFSDEERLGGNRINVAAAIHDLDCRLYGKSGIFFNMGTCFYEVMRSNKHNHLVYGFGKVIVDHPGAVLSLFDDVMGITFGEACVTKNIKVHFMVAPEQICGKTLKVQARSVVTTENDKSTIVTKSDMKDDSGNILAWGEATFIQTAQLKQLSQRQASLEDQEKHRLEVWGRMAKFRVAGQSPDDPTMSFVLRTDDGVEKLMPPAEWTSEMYKSYEQTHLLDGRVQLEHIACKNDSCRAVAHPLLTSEGPPGRMHGGCAATTWLDVLSHELDLRTIKEISLTYRRPVDLLSTVYVQWTKINEECWQCKITDSQNNLLQTMEAKVVDTAVYTDPTSASNGNQARL